VPDGHLNFWVW